MRLKRILTDFYNEGTNSTWLAGAPVEIAPPTGEPILSDLSGKYSGEVEKLLEVGKEKEYLTYDDINRLLPPDMNSADDIEAIFDVIGAEGISISDSDEKFIEAAAAAVGNGDGKLEDGLDEELDLALTPGTLEKTNNPVSWNLREMP